MTDHAAGARTTCIATAAEFMAAQPEGPDRALDKHRRLPDGHCAGCLTSPTPWPCTAAVIARLAIRLTAAEGDNAPR
jgi:hypothetical protein